MDIRNPYSLATYARNYILDHEYDLYPLFPAGGDDRHYEAFVKDLTGELEAAAADRCIEWMRYHKSIGRKGLGSEGGSDE